MSSEQPETSITDPNDAGPSARSTGKKRGRNDRSPTPEGDAETRKKAREHDPLVDEPGGAQALKLKSKDIPREALGTKNALQIHLRILANNFSSLTPPSPPTEAAKNQFHSRFRRYEDLEKVRKGAPRAQVQVSEAIRQLRSEISRSHIAKEASRITDTILGHIFSLLPRYGLLVWRPDLDEPPDSLWNRAHRLIAIDSFRDAFHAFGYIACKPRLEYVESTSTLTEFYNNYVFFYWRVQLASEREKPGSVLAKREQSKMYRRRKQLAERRGKYLEAQGYPYTAVALVSSIAGTSDDELDPVTKSYVVKEKEGRSKRIAQLVCRIDEKRTMVDRFLSARNKSVQRVRPETPQKSAQLTLPKDVPLDWFEPDFFNDLPLSLRANYNPIIGFPGDDGLLLNSTPSDWVGLTKDAFMEKYGAEVLKKYKLPTEEELQRMTGEEFDDKEDKEDEGPMDLN